MRVLINFTVLLIFSLSVNYVTCSDEKRYCNDGLGECTVFSACSNATVFNHGDDTINVRFNIEQETEACHYLEMCCDPEDVIPVQNYYPDVEVETSTFFIGNQIQESTTHHDVDLGNRGSEDSTPNPDYDDVTNSQQGRNNHDGSTVPPGFQKVPVGNNNNVTPKIPTDHSDGGCNDDAHECIPFFFCAQDHTTDGSNAFSSRSGVNAGCTAGTQVCCPKEFNIVRMKPTVCGHHNKDGIGYSVTNSVDEAQFAEFPWMAALIEVNAQGNIQYLCGGSLIDPNVILTAAHCVSGKDPNRLGARLGEWDTQTDKEILPHFDYRVSRIIVNDDFGPINLINDIALLVLERPVELKVHINTVCLPPANFKLDGPSMASGWGADKFNDETAYRVNLKKVELPIVPLKDCQDSLRTTKLGPRFKIHPSFMCAGGERDIDTCTGDGGSPLVIPVPGHEEIYYQAGIVAWGIECGQENIPGVYTNVAKFRNWIDAHMNELGFGTRSYTIL